MDAQKQAEVARRRELAGQLDEFRSRQNEVDRSAGGEGGEEVGGWKKRKRREEKGGKLGLKVRRTSEIRGKRGEEKPETKGEKVEEVKEVEEMKEKVVVEEPVAKGLGLVDYDSDSEDD